MHIITQRLQFSSFSTIVKTSYPFGQEVLQILNLSCSPSKPNSASLSWVFYSSQATRFSAILFHSGTYAHSLDRTLNEAAPFPTQHTSAERRPRYGHVFSKILPLVRSDINIIKRDCRITTAVSQRNSVSQQREEWTDNDRRCPAAEPQWSCPCSPAAWPVGWQPRRLRRKKCPPARLPPYRSSFR